MVERGSVFRRLRTLVRRAAAIERERIARALEYEASITPCHEDAGVTESNAKLVRARFSYSEAFDA